MVVLCGRTVLGASTSAWDHLHTDGDEARRSLGNGVQPTYRSDGSCRWRMLMRALMPSGLSRSA
jgi:hypothetical protein